MLWTTLRSTSLLLVAIASCLDAAQERLTAEQMSDAIFIETVSTPTPGEFFLALGKQSQPNWSKLLRSTVPVATSDREQIAMQLGMLVADGFMAIEAQDGQSVKNTTRDILTLAKKLNVSQQIVARGQSISDLPMPRSGANSARNWMPCRMIFDSPCWNKKTTRLWF